MKVGVKICFGRIRKRTSCYIRITAACCLMLVAVTELLRTLLHQSLQQSMPDDFRYRLKPGTNNSEVGEVLETAESYRDLLDKPLRSAIELTPDNAKDFIFVTASDSKFFHPDMDAIGNVQRLFPNRSIIFYDLDENKSTNDIVKNPTAIVFANSWFYWMQIKQLCGVIYRKFNFTKYPKHVHTLYTYAWKPLVITEVLSEYPVLFYIDSSIRFLSNNFSLVFSQAIQSGGILTFGYTYHTIFPATHPGMYRYLPIPRARAIDVPVREAGHIYVARTRDIYANVIRWWTACALVEPCIAPTMNRTCRIRVMNVYSNCHRFDQSALNILVANHFDYDAGAYSYLNTSKSASATITVARRRSAQKENVSMCLPNGQRQFNKSKQYFA